jgi:hypothetical protein
MATDSLRFINAIVGFCTRTKTWPHPLADLGYVACGIEREIVVDLGRQNRKVVVDLICASSALDHALCAETKSQTVPLDQAQRYRAMTSRDLINMANLPTGVAAADLTHDVIYASAAEHAELVAQQLRNASLTFPVLACNTTRFALFDGVVGKAELQALFSQGINIRPEVDEWPLSYIPFTGQSDDSEIVAYVAQIVSSFLLRGEGFSADELAIRLLSNWEWFGQEEQRRLKRRFAALVNSAMKHELKGYIERQTGRQEWSALRGRLQPPNQTARLAEQMTEFVRRIQEEVPIQKGLFEESSER